MQVDILEYSEETRIAKIKFSHNDVIHIDTYNLDYVVPGTKKILAELSLPFTAAIKDAVVAKLTLQIQKEIEDGILKNAI